MVSMDISTLPQHIVVDILYYTLKQSSLSSGLRMRLVCRRINQELLYAFYTLRAPDIRSRWPYGHIIPFDELAMVRYLHGLASRPGLQPKLHGNPNHWLNTINVGSKILQTLAPNADRLRLMHEHKHTVELRGSVEWVYKRIICETMVTFLGAEECYTLLVSDERTSANGTPHTCILNKPVDFWVVMACCHIGNTSAVEQAITTMRPTADPKLDWHSQLSGCMYVASRKGRVDVVRQLIAMDFDVNEQAFRGCLRYCGGDGTPLCGATAYGSLDLVELFLTHDIVKEGSPYHWAMYECMNYTDKFEERVKIMDRLLQEDKSERTDQDLHRKLLAWTCKSKKPKVTSTITKTCQPIEGMKKETYANPNYPTEFGKAQQWG